VDVNVSVIVSVIVAALGNGDDIVGVIESRVDALRQADRTAESWSQLISTSEGAPFATNRGTQRIPGTPAGLCDLARPREIDHAHDVVAVPERGHDHGDDHAHVHVHGARSRRMGG
jgi:hypothetical protein